ncbi:hypothetical protein [Lederbergia citrea]|uniref:Glycerophosphoryl diester phosphodiesterase membrane domain-containing protein n=1 Tax=Lederbergia citrea TaxID=2833581 RepID=A0A942UY42_9BACI|nr:hypothetical protein [Lederbergia citrea]MBS4179492.1 hypothetical protein [Lederbergia citrea]MBS4224904.1 hypothetical protein [Lederbergia citrea]
MDKPVSFAFSLFAGKYEKFLIIVFLVQIPFLLIHSFITNYIYAITPTFGSLFSIADIYYAFITLLLLLFVLIPFVKFTINEYQGNENSLKTAFYSFAVQGFNIFVFSVLLALAAVIGFMFFFIPGLIILAAFISAPIIALNDEKSVWKSVRESLQIFKKHFLGLIFCILLFSLLELGIGVFLNFIILSITPSYAAIMITQIFLNTIFFPIFIVVLTSLTIKWRENLSSLRLDKNKAFA